MKKKITTKKGKIRVGKTHQAKEKKKDLKEEQ